MPGSTMFQKVDINQNFVELFEKGARFGVISLRDIAKAIPKSMKKDKKTVEKILDWLLACFEQLKIMIVSEEIAKQICKRNAQFKRHCNEEPQFAENPEEKKALEVLGDEMFSLFKNLDISRKNGDIVQTIALRNRIVEDNLALVKKVARDHSRFIKDVAIDQDDLVQEGALGLIRAINDFNYLRGLRLSVYAYWWIEQHIRRYKNNGSAIRITEYMRNNIAKLRKKRGDLHKSLGRDPVDKEVSDSLGWSIEKYVTTLSVMDFNQKMFSLDHPINADCFEEGRFFSEIISLDSISGDAVGNMRSDYEFESIAKRELFRFLVNKMVAKSKLSDRVKYCFEQYFWEERTLRDIGGELGLSHERIRQLIDEVLETLKSNHRLIELAEFNPGDGFENVERARSSKLFRKNRRLMRKKTANVNEFI